MCADEQVSVPGWSPPPSVPFGGKGSGSFDTVCVSVMEDLNCTFK